MTITALSLMTAVIFIFGLAYSSSSIAYNTPAKHAFLIDFDTDQVLFEKNADVLMPPASMSKIMTAYLAFEEIKSGRLELEDKILISENAWRKGGSKMFVKVIVAIAHNPSKQPCFTLDERVELANKILARSSSPLVAK